MKEKTSKGFGLNVNNSWPIALR